MREPRKSFSTTGPETTETIIETYEHADLSSDVVKTEVDGAG